MPVVGVGVWQTAVPARDDLGFVDVDEDLGMSGWASATVADGHALVDEADGLLVDELDGGVGARITIINIPAPPTPSAQTSAPPSPPPSGSALRSTSLPGSAPASSSRAPQPPPSQSRCLPP